MRKKNFPYAENSCCFQPTDSVLFVLQFKVDLPGVFKLTWVPKTRTP